MKLAPTVIDTIEITDRNAGAEYLKILQFYLNHRVLKESERPERIGKSPREILTGESHSHWLELLGFKRLHLCA